MTKRKLKVFVAISGGVDSSVAAALLKKRNYDVVGVHMKCYNLDGCGEQEAEDARRAAEILKIPFYVFDFEKEYKDKVVEYIVEGYRKGITPNPDVMCNKEIKFGMFLKGALAMGADYVATGHYVRLQNQKLFQAKDKNKDQSYFLWTLTQEQLKHCLFPIGEYIKPQVRKLAKKFGLPNAEKKDSQGICFLGKIALKDFLKSYLPEKKGIVLNTSGQIIGEHNGAHFCTIGQRHLGIYQQPIINSQQPLYVAEKDIKSNAILVAEEDHPMLYKKEVKLKSVNLLNKELRIPVMARVRYRQPLVPAKFIAYNSLFKLVFSKPVKFVASGQSAVFYSQKGEMLGGGVIV